MYLKRLKLFLIFTHLIKSLNHKKHPPRLVYGSHKVIDSVTQQVILPLNLEVLRYSWLFVEVGTDHSLLQTEQTSSVLILGKGPTFAE